MADEREHTSDTPLDKRDALLIWRVFHTMPYAAGLVRNANSRGELPYHTIGDVLDLLRELSERLRLNADHETKRDYELYELRGLQSTVRKLLAPLAGDFDVVDGASNVLATFRTEEEASAYIETLPNFEDGRYGIDKRVHVQLTDGVVQIVRHIEE